MGTRGVVGIRFNEEDKLGYNHWDSYPSGLGAEVLDFLKGKSLPYLKELYDEIDISGDKGDGWDWSAHTLNLEFEDYQSFLKDSLFCEWAYIINLDDSTLEIYEGFNKDPYAAGRYASLYRKDHKDRSGYVGVALFKTFSLEDCFNGKVEVMEDKDDFTLREKSTPVD